LRAEFGVYSECPGKGTSVQFPYDGEGKRNRVPICAVLVYQSPIEYCSD
jgi:hypothetical protein